MASNEMDGRVCLVTGATSGIGRATAAGLAKRGATVVLVARDPVRGEATRREIVAESGNARVDLIVADLASQASIRAGAAAFRAKYPALHVLVNQAGLVVSERTLTVDGIEHTFAVNHLAYYLLTHLLLDRLEAGAPSRVINGTGAIFNAGDIDFGNLRGEKTAYSAFRALAQSKLANVLFNNELARRLEGRGVTVNCFHPGGVKTNLGAGAGGILGLLTKLARPFWLTPEQGAEPAIYLASSPAVANVTGAYFDRMKRGTTAGKTHDRALGEKLWEASAALTGIDATRPDAPSPHAAAAN